MEIIITEIAQRIRDLREIMGYSVEEMAQAVDCTPEEYIASEMVYPSGLLEKNVSGYALCEI